MQGSFVTGWAASAAAKPCTITVADDHGTLIATGLASVARPGSGLEGSQTDWAFRVELPGYAKPGAVHVSADGIELPGSPLEFGPGCYDGACRIDGAMLKGWVRERISALTEPDISIVTQHGVIVGQGPSRAVAADGPGAVFEIELNNSCFGAGELRLRVLADGVQFAETSCHLALLGSLDLITAEAAAGWLVAPQAPGRRLEIEIFRNDTAVARVRCGDPPQADFGPAPSRADGGFAARFSASEAVLKQPARISLRLCGAATDLFEGPYIVAGPQTAIVAAQRAARMTRALAGIGLGEKTVIQQALAQFLVAARGGQGLAAGRQSVCAHRREATRLHIIVPIYRDVAAARDCIDSVLAQRTAPLDRLVLINDASPEPGMGELLETYAQQPNLFVLTNDRHLGLVKTVNRGFAFAGCNDVLLLNPDVIVYRGAFDELYDIAHRSPEIGTVIALCDDATSFSYPGPGLRQTNVADCEWAELAGVALAKNAGTAINIPAAHGSCLLIKGDVLREAGFFDAHRGDVESELRAFCARAADLGYRHVAAAGVLIRQCGNLTAGGEKAARSTRNLGPVEADYPEYLAGLREFERKDGLRQARWALDAWRLRRARRGGLRLVLVVSNGLEGGAARALMDVETAVGYGAAAKLCLQCRDDGGIEVFAEAPTFHASFAITELDAVFKLLDAAAPGHVLVHQLLGYPAAFIRRLGSWVQWRKSFYFLHDFYPLCPRVTFIDTAGNFCKAAKAGICERCLRAGGGHESSKLGGLTAYAHRELFAQALQGFDAIIAPSASAGNFLRRGFPNLKVEVIAHPETGILPAGHAAGQLGATSPAIRRAEDAAEITLFGAIGPHKGSARLLEIARRAKTTNPRLSFRVIGYTNLDAQLRAAGNVIITGAYTSARLPQLAAEARGDLALFLHEWPETYSYTLSEALSYGFVPLAPDLGAPAERVRAMRFGIVFPHPADATAVLQLIEDILAKRVPRFAEGACPEDFHPGEVASKRLQEILKI